MEVINLKKKTIVEVDINGLECICTLDNTAIDHFQRTNKEGLLKFYDKLQKAEKTGSVEITPVIKLLGSMLREKKTGRILGENYLKQFDSMDVLTHLSPLLQKAFTTNLPEAKTKTEKK